MKLPLLKIVNASRSSFVVSGDFPVFSCIGPQKFQRALVAALLDNDHSLLREVEVFYASEF